MEQKFYSNIEMKRYKYFVKDKFGVKRLLKIKKLQDRTLILINFQYARHLGFYNVKSLLESIGVTDPDTPLYHDIDNNKVYAMVKDNTVELIKKDPSFELMAVFAPN
jgi:hypothetical protein